MNYFETIIEAIGNTPLIKLNAIAKEIEATVLIKNEASNPTGSISDRVVKYTLEKAEQKKWIREEGTIIEATSANTAISYANIAIVHGYKVIAVITDKESQEKQTLLKALGAEVIICPNESKPKDSRSKSAVAKRLHQRTPNSWLINHDLYELFVEAHYQNTANEIWNQTEGKLNHVIIPVTTGATIEGVSKFLKEKKPTIKIWGVDSYGSVLKKYYDTGIYDENEVYPYEVEGVGSYSILEKSDFSQVDGFIKINDKDAAIQTAQLAKKEGLILGNSSGAAIGALYGLKKEFSKEDIVVIIAKDDGNRYLSKIFNEEWMRSRGFLEKPVSVASDLVKDPTADVITVKTSELVSHAVARMRKYKISQIPVVDSHGFVGSIDEKVLFSAYLDDHRKDNTPISEIMNAPFPIVNSFTSIEEIASLIHKGNTAVIVALDNEKHGIITKSDVISHLQ